SATPSSAATLARWLAEQQADQARADAGRRRIESDADAVAVHTIHGAKGLEFPVVLLPSLWEGPWTDDDDPPVFHDADGGRAIGVGGSGLVHRQQVAAARHELAEEELRLLYVAMTRARHRVVVWWATAGDARHSPFARVLLGRDPVTGAVDEQLRRSPDEASVRLALLALVAPSSGAIAVEEATGPDGRADARAPIDPAGLAVRPFDRGLDRRWVRTSYSGLTAAAHDLGPAPAAEAVEVDERATADEPVTAAAGPPDPFDAPVPLDEVPGGARVGTLVHDILERTDFASGDLAGALATAAAEAGARRLLPSHADALVAGLVAALETPLGPLFDGRRLRDLGRQDRLDELAFDLPLAGGDTPSGVVTMDAIAAVFASLPGDGPLAGCAERLGDPRLAAEVRGFLTGSIDLVARVGGRYVVVDYKTNRLAPAGERLTAHSYRPEALAAAMLDAHYPLQAALYEVALHRFLRWRLSAYDPARHLGGVAYLFLRGMAGPATPVTGGQSAGVFAWQPPAAFVLALSDLLDQGAP
ncbi:MAG: 3'-5' exonuclease, partial [Acidimicrobiales bacterium]